MNPVFSRTLVAVSLAALLPSSLQAAIIHSDDIHPIPQHLVGSGNGTLDLRMFTYSGSEITNATGSFNGDNGNKTLPQGGGADTGSFAESYVTTAGELKAYYTLNFPNLTSPEIVLILDLNETGDGQLHNSLDTLDIILNPATIQGNPDPLGDVSGAAQAAIDQVFTGGTRIACLDPQPAANLPTLSQGAGAADYAIFTGINPFTLSDTDVILFNLSMSTLNDGAEDIFLSGSWTPSDIRNESLPEPATLTLAALATLPLLTRRKR